jgi:hypothetical protein
MTTVRLQVEGKLRWAVLVCLAFTTPAFGQDSSVHWRHAGAMPPGAIGRQRLLRGGPLSGYCQPVEIRAPRGARIAPAIANGFDVPQPDRLLVGLQIGPVYRFKVTEIPGHPGVEVFPTVEMVDRMYPPPGQALRFPVPVELTQQELELAADGRFVTRVIYVEDPQLALPVAERQDSETRWIEVRPGEDPLVTADGLGRPIAILRMGGRTPEPNQAEPGFVYGAPPAKVYNRPNTLPAPAVQPTPPVEQVLPAPAAQAPAGEPRSPGSGYKLNVF